MHKKPAFYREHELVALLKSNNKCAYEYLYDHYGPPLYGIVCKILKDQTKAQDVLQDSFIKIWKNIGHYQPEKGTLFTWILNIARHTAIDLLRADVKFESHIKWEAMQEKDLSSAAVIFPLPAAMDVRTIVGRLPAERRQVIELVYFQGYTHEQTSIKLKLPLGTVKSRLRVAIKDLRCIFGAPNLLAGLV